MWMTILVGLVVFSAISYILSLLMDLIIDKKSSCLGIGIVFLIAGISTFFICKFFNYNVFGGKQAEALVNSYKPIISKIEPELSKSTPHTNTSGLIIVHRNSNGVLEVLVDEMRKVPLDCRANPNLLPERVILFGAREEVIGYCNGACPGGHEITETHYWSIVNNLSTGTQYVNDNASSGDLKNMIHEFCQTDK
jgi:hypothetical protein